MHKVLPKEMISKDCYQTVLKVPACEQKDNKFPPAPLQKNIIITSLSQ
jgi:hypothetical protein